jgi:hypothetical protein
MKQLKWYDTLTLLDVKLIRKLKWENIVPNALNMKEEFQVEKSLIKTQALKAIFQGKGSLEQKIREAYVKDLLTRCYYKELHKWRKVKSITLKERYIVWMEIILNQCGSRDVAHKDHPKDHDVLMLGHHGNKPQEWLEEECSASPK